MPEPAARVSELPLGGADASRLAPRLGSGHRWPTSWDPSLSQLQHALLRADALLRPGAGARAWIAGDDLVSAARLSPLAWDSDHFGVSMAALALAPHGRVDDTAAVLADAVRLADASGVRHLRVALDTGDHATLRLLQQHGFRVAWVYARIVCDTARLRTAEPGLPIGVEVTETTPAHLEPLLAITERLAPYSWIEGDVDLPEAIRARYVATRLRNCVETDLADLCQTLLIRGRPAGFNASRLRTHAPIVGSDTRFSWELDTFVDPMGPPGLGIAFERAVVAALRDRVRFVLGRVRLDGVAMFRATERAGFATDGGEFVLVRRSPPRLVTG